jgi:hypothetical protein
MINDINQIPPPVWAAIVVAAFLLLCSRSNNRSTRRLSGGYRPQGPERSFDECFPEQPMRIRHGIVAERKEVMLPQYSLSSVRLPRPNLVPHYAFTIICHDVIGEEKLEITAEKNKVNVFADAGRSVEVQSQFSRLDHHHMVHAITAV